MSGGGLALAFAAGAASFLTPCVLPLVPGYLSVISGVDIDELQAGAAATRARVLHASLLFIAGFSAVFIALGAVAGALGGTLRDYAPELQRLSGILVVAMGLALAGVLPAGPLARDLRPGLDVARRSGSPVLLGASFGLCWTPCVGPVLASILLLGTRSEDAAGAAVLLAAYAAGLAVPLLALAVAFGRMLGAFRWVRDRYEIWRVVSGVVLVLLGLALFFDRFWLLNVYAGRLFDALGLELPSV